ncbi:YitT family protein [Roseococcus sp. YIM B11640]|uniref:YitT family protein n=1 Tax=Roseococcus sp. YIM B11640 TaxID=3133973 RepID=UPI003C7DABAC
MSQTTDHRVILPAPRKGPQAGATLVGSPHSLWDDAAALVIGVSMVSLGLSLYAEARLTTSGLAGLALLLGYVTPLDPGTLFFLLNIPFLVFGATRMGWKVLLRTVVTIAAVAIATRLAPYWIAIGWVAPPYAALLGGVLIGMGVLGLVRHRTGLGGTNLVAMYLQEKRGWSAGWLQLGFDALVMLAALFVLDWRQVALSMFGALVLNLIVAMNHKPGRYLGVS